MKLVDLLFLEKPSVTRTVNLVNSHTYTSIVIFMDQLAEGFQTWKNIQERDLNYNPVLALKILVTNSTITIYRHSCSLKECFVAAPSFKKNWREPLKFSIMHRY